VVVVGNAEADAYAVSRKVVEAICGHSVAPGSGCVSSIEEGFLATLGMTVYFSRGSKPRCEGM
jgi:hypothetical protein